jgi:pimeloyl-ACP methyl ester carboxylesterase
MTPLPFLDLGDPAGFPVLVLDGPNSRGLARAIAPAAAATGVRVVAPDRPGAGSIVDVAAQLLALAGHLGLERFGILGQSGGTPYALSLAGAAGDRVAGVSLTGAVAPGLRIGGPMGGLARMAGRAPWLARVVIGAFGRRAGKDPEGAAKRFAKDLPPGDRAALEDPEKWRIHVEATPEILGRPAALVHEMRLLQRDWGFDVSSVRAPVALWVGSADVVHPPAHSRRLSELLGGAPVHVVQDAATFGLAPAYPDVLAWAAGSSRARITRTASGLESMSR